jgi:hypothetical protein
VRLARGDWIRPAVAGVNARISGNRLFLQKSLSSEQRIFKKLSFDA